MREGRTATDTAPNREPQGFFRNFLIELKLWSFFLVLLFSTRVVFISVFPEHLAEGSGTWEITQTLISGLRFDVKVATLWLLPLVLLDLLVPLRFPAGWLHRIRLAWSAFFIFSVILLAVIQLGYFQEYRDLFNEELFGLIEDDTAAIFVTLHKEYGLVWKLALVLLATALCTSLLRRFLSVRLLEPSALERWLGSFYRRLGAGFLVLIFVVVGARGSIGPRPAQLKDAAVTRDLFLNKAELNAPMALYYAVRAHQEIAAGSGLGIYLPDGNVRTAAKAYFDTHADLASLDDYMLTGAAGPKGRVPRHIFVVVMESYHSWPTREEYADLRLSEGLKRLGREGLWLRRFLPASRSTMRSLSAIIAGLPAAGLRINLERASGTVFPTAAAEIFKRLGYRTNLFYGGYLSWHRIGEFSKAQGFDNVYGAAHIADWNRTNEWGVDDESLFDFVRKSVTDDQPSFSLILSTTNHPPYDIDVRARGFPLQRFPQAILDDLDPKLDPEAYLHQLGHFWYADHVMEQFVLTMESRLPDSLFLISGDHYGRDHVKARPSLYDRSSVPLVFYGPKVLAGLSLGEDAAGSHLDIVPTLVELAAPEGFEYHRLGMDLFANPRARFGIGDQKVIGRDFLVDLNTGEIEAPGRSEAAIKVTIEQLRQRHNLQHGISWWRVKRGPELPPVEAPSASRAGN